MNLTLAYPTWYILLCLALGALASFILYYRDWQFKDLGKSFKKWLWVLAVVRFLAVSFLAFLLLSPLVRTISNRIEKPIVVVAQDNSQSIRQNLKGADSARYAQAMGQLVEELSKNYEVNTYSFGSSVKEGLNLSFNDKTTNISAALDEIASTYKNQNLGAIILATDGIYNEGSNPVYLDNELNVPVYTIGLGDTTMKRDLRISNVVYNRTVFYGDYFPVKVEWQAQFCPNEISRISISEISENGNRKLDEKQITITANDVTGTSDFLLKADKAGIIHYRIALDTVSIEASTANNRRDIFLEVVEKKEKILILANSPHPDIAAIKQAVESNKNYSVTVAFGTAVPDKIEDYNLVILHQLPSSANNVQSVIENIKSRKKSILFILGSQTSPALLNNAQTILSLSGGNGSTTDAFPVINADFNLFNIPDNVKQVLSHWPPLAAPFGEYRVSPGAVTLFAQRIGSVTTKYPLLVFQQDLDGRAAIIAGEGLWRWRINDYQESGNQDAFNSLMSSIVQYLSVKADERQFRVRLEKEQQGSGNHIFSENESIVFHGELLNESNELINDPDPTLTVKDAEGKEYPFVFSKTGNSYSLNAGYFPVGDYTYQAKVNYNKKHLFASGSFTVSATQLEFESTRANHQLLYALSQKTGGKLVYPSQLNDLEKTIGSKQEIKPILYSSTRTEPLINLRWLIVPILLLLALEWGIRKFNGGY
jgi:hypothetical protein